MTAESFTNQFLIAMPTLVDPNFFRTVTLICEHNEQGALGIVLNQPTDLKLDGLLSHLEITASEPDIGDTPVFHGGPVHPEQGFVLHRPLGDWDSTLAITGELGLTSSRDILVALAAGAGPTRSLIALGYAGWGAGQLEEELAANAWLTVQADPRIIFDTPPEQRWRAAAEKLGIDLDLLASDPGHA